MARTEQHILAGMIAEHALSLARTVAELESVREKNAQLEARLLDSMTDQKPAPALKRVSSTTAG